MSIHYHPFRFIIKMWAKETVLFMNCFWKFNKFPSIFHSSLCHLIRALRRFSASSLRLRIRRICRTLSKRQSPLTKYHSDTNRQYDLPHCEFLFINDKSYVPLYGFQSIFALILFQIDLFLSILTEAILYPFFLRIICLKCFSAQHCFPETDGLSSNT